MAAACENSPAPPTVAVVSTLAASGDTSQKKRDFFNFSQDIAIDASGNLYVTDFDSHRIQKISPTGEVSTLVGSGKRGFEDGKGDEAQFCRPSGIAVDAADNLYVSDSGNGLIRKIVFK